MFSAKKACEMAQGFIPDMRRIYEAIMEDTRQILVRLERRFKSYSQQQFIFVTALDRCRKINFEPNAKVTTISQVQLYAEEVADNATDKRIFAIFLSLVKDLGEFRRTLAKIVKTKDDKKLNYLFSTWKKILEPRFDISNLRAVFPHNHVNHLSCDEARNHFGGIVSLIPVAMSCAREVVERIEKTRAYRDIKPFIESNTAETSTARPDTRNSCCRPRTIDPKARSDIPLPRTTKELECQEQKAFERGGPHGGWLSQQGPPSPPPSSAATSLLPSPASSKDVLKRGNENNSSTSRNKTPDCCDTYVEQLKSRQGSRKGVSTQTPHYLATTIEPNLNWPHETISEGEMRRLMRSQKHCIVRPKWKP